MSASVRDHEPDVLAAVIAARQYVPHGDGAVVGVKVGRLDVRGTTMRDACGARF